MTPLRSKWEPDMSTPRRPRSLARFRESEVTRIAKAVSAAGGGKVTLDPSTGRYTIVIGATEADTTDENPWDEGNAAQRLT
jgi:hypothetical protein